MTAPVTLYPGGRLPPDATAGWLPAALAELTHAPTGHSGLGAAAATLSPGDAGGAQCYPAGDALLVVLGGQLAIEFGPGLATTVVAAAGDAVAIASGTVHRERHGGGNAPVRFLRIAPGGPALPA